MSKKIKSQAKTQRIRLRKLVADNLKAKEDVKVIIDDESYFTLDGNEWQSQDYYYHESSSTSDEVRYIEQQKFTEKVLMWLCISKRGMSKPKFFKSGLGIKGDTYLTQCILEVKKFIQKYHSRDKVLFWPDLAFAHYSAVFLEKLRKIGIPFVLKDENPPNVLQMRSTEDLWPNIKEKFMQTIFRPKMQHNLLDE